MGRIAILRCLKGAAELVVVSADDETDPPLTVAAGHVSLACVRPSSTRNLRSVIGLWFECTVPDRRNTDVPHALATLNRRKPMIDLYFWPTGNGKKTVILLEELGLPYTIKPINIGRGDHAVVGLD
jgi:hypothetical protein